MIGAPFEVSPFFVSAVLEPPPLGSPEAVVLAAVISLIMAWLRQPSARSSAPWRCISFSRTFPALSIKLTPQRFTRNFERGVVAESSRQHCSRVATRGPERLPSTVMYSFPRFDSVVIRSISEEVPPRESGTANTKWRCTSVIANSPPYKYLEHYSRN